ncbi:hypothetical protein V6N13_088212 [Hibiscus sabdariffa]|uniref:Uncharacterized protein n=1 Tax=Hibiscus sabdariffa TaxID=183260 RepID=A0ABR2FZ08_9ROSI
MKNSGHKGIKFSESNNVPFVELTVRNGSSPRLRIPDAYVTSYKPKVYWKDDSLEEILYTDADNDAIDALQVELSCSAGTLDISYVISLYPLSIATAVIVKC